MKADWSKAFGKFRNRLLVGGEWTSSKNRGRGTYYADMRYAPRGGSIVMMPYHR